jgi:hypothetical protein
LHLAHTMEAQRCPYEALDRARPCQLGTQSEEVADGWPATPTQHRMEQPSLGWYERASASLIMAVNPVGVVTGFGFFSAASTTDRQIAETLFAVRHQPDRRRLASVGCASQGPYIADKGFEGAQKNHQRWLECATGRKKSSIIRPNAEQPQTLLQA